jgi:hypothetical protein
VHRPLTQGWHQAQSVLSYHVCGSTSSGQEGLCIVEEPRTGGETNTTPNHRLQPTASRCDVKVVSKEWSC